MDKTSYNAVGLSDQANECIAEARGDDTTPFSLTSNSLGSKVGPVWSQWIYTERPEQDQAGD